MHKSFAALRKDLHKSSASTNIAAPTKNTTIKEEILGQPNGAAYLLRVRDQARVIRATWGKDLRPTVLEEELVRAAADYKRVQRG